MISRRSVRAALLSLATMALATAVAAGSGGINAAGASAAQFLVGADAEDLTPPAAQMASYVAAKNFYLGGYGLGSGTSQIGPLGTPIPCSGLPNVPCFTPRYATGVMQGPHVYVRAVVISDGKRSLAFAELDTQGMFAAYKPNPANLAARPYGIDDVRSAVANQTGGALAFDDITISGDHSHAGQDLIGVWGFVPDDYLAFVKAQATKALLTAYANRQPATLREGAAQTPGPCDNNRILNDQFDCSMPPNNVMDPEMRTMRAFAASDGHIIATILNFAAHATVMGGGNNLLSPDWPGVAAQQMQDRYGGIGITVVSDVGRSQPNRGDCTAAEKTSGQYVVDSRQVDDSCRLSKYAAAVMGYVDQAVANETPLTQNQIDGRELFIRDPATNVGIVGLNYAGDAAGAPVARSLTPPYLTANVLGTWVGVYRIGDLVITTNPGEAYPNIRQQFMDAVPGGRRYWTTGLSNDQLGYLIAPFPEGYPQAIQASAGGNDNILFNASETIGDRVMCTQVKGAMQMGLAQSSPPVKCAAYAAEPNTYGPGGVETGPPPTNPPPTDFQGNPVNVSAGGRSSGPSSLSNLPNTASSQPQPADQGRRALAVAVLLVVGLLGLTVGLATRRARSRGSAAG